MDELTIITRTVSSIWCLIIFGIIFSLAEESTETMLLVTVFSIAFTCPCLWSIIRFAEDWDQKRKLVVIPEKKKKKKINIAINGKGKPLRTQAEILAEQRKKAKKLHGVGNKKKEKKTALKTKDGLGKKPTKKPPKRKKAPT